MADANGRGQGGSPSELSSNPGIPTLDQGAGKEEVLKALRLITTKTRGLQRITERSKAGCGVEHPMGNQPTDIRHSPVQREQEDGLPSRRPIKAAKRWEKLGNAVGGSRVKAEEKRVG